MTSYGMAGDLEHRARRRKVTSNTNRLLIALYQIALGTGARQGELLALRWRDVDLDAGWWTIPGSRAKNGRAHRVPAPFLPVDSSDDQ